VDIRADSSTFGKWTGVYLSESNHRQIFISKGFAHGFCVLSNTALVLYKCTEFYHPEDEKGILWCDPGIGINWPVKNPHLSERDRQFPCLRDVPAEFLLQTESKL
ncbi:MAG: dTDP-4-dehydrorhamnose 3,5-epimerase family protein, partial [Deltaproteobacteria bacterium]|nr:dTDP-4-dehydrorhamnose 3,5-epimerase family protein [Deltaproteobacteria bacterium]